MFGVRVTQMDPETISMEMIQWSTLTDGAPPAVQLASQEAYYTGLKGRVEKHLEGTEYPSETEGVECPAGMGPVAGGYGYGMEGYGGY